MLRLILLNRDEEDEIGEQLMKSSVEDADNILSLRILKENFRAPRQVSDFLFSSRVLFFCPVFQFIELCVLPSVFLYFHSGVPPL